MTDSNAFPFISLKLKSRLFIAACIFWVAALLPLKLFTTLVLGQNEPSVDLYFRPVPAWSNQSMTAPSDGVILAGDENELLFEKEYRFLIGPLFYIGGFFLLGNAFYSIKKYS